MKETNITYIVALGLLQKLNSSATKPLTPIQILKIVKLVKGLNAVQEVYTQTVSKLMEDNNVSIKQNGTYDVPKEKEEEINLKVNEILAAKIENNIELNFIDENTFAEFIQMQQFNLADATFLYEYLVEK